MEVEVEASVVPWSRSQRRAVVAAVALAALAGRMAVAAQAPADPAQPNKPAAPPETNNMPSPAPPTRLVHRYLSTRISPDGLWIAAVEGDAPPDGAYPPTRALVLHPLHGKGLLDVPLACGKQRECWPGSPAWSADSRHVYFTLRTPGQHSYSLYSAAIDGSEPFKMLDFDGTIVDLRMMPDGRLAMLATPAARKESGATEAAAPLTGDLDETPPIQRLAVLDHGNLQWQSPPELYVYEYDWLPGGQNFVGTAASGDGDANWWLARLYQFAGEAQAARTLYTPIDIHQQLAHPRVSADGRTVAFIAGIMSDFGSTGGDVYTLPIAGGSATNLTPGVLASATSLSWGCSGHLLVAFLAGDSTQLTDLGPPGAPQNRVLWRAAETLEGDEALLSTACKAALTATVHESFTQPPEIAVGPIGQWHDITTANSGLSSHAQVRSLQWVSDRFNVQGWLLLPENVSGKVPLITLVHGGPAAAARPYFSGPGLAESLLERGYALLQPNPRGSYGQGERFTLANYRDFGYGDLRDILAGIDAAEKAAPIDDRRLGITGGSYGGFMTMWAVTQTRRFKAAVAAAGVSNWISYYGENGIDTWMLPYFGASAYNDPAVYARSSAISFITQARTPTLAYVGERDLECPAPQTLEFWRALKSQGVPAAIMVYPGEGHSLRDPAHVADALERTLQWFDRYLH